MPDDAVKLTLPPGVWPRIRKLAGQTSQPIDGYLVALIVAGVGKAEAARRPAPAAPQAARRAPGRFVDVP